MEYTIVEGFKVEEVIAAVNELLKLGWELYGNPVITGIANTKEDSTRYLYAQAMIKKAAEQWSAA
ncbi:MAG: DUF1737 domain-containing protein [Acidobacteria bacterium]|jgi:hypothetical protein|nr:DUF1737 domain-containing protein [Acidobacteriota bacterium]